jgi:hypothetical protein
MNTDQGPFVLPNLRTLKARLGKRWIPQLICPNLTTYIAPFIGHPQVLDDMPWILLHPTLTRLESYLIGNYEAFAIACPQLEHLVVHDVSTINPESLLLPRFLALKKLGLHILPGQFTISAAEKIAKVVTSRCLSNSGIGSSKPPFRRASSIIRLLAGCKL